MFDSLRCFVGPRNRQCGSPAPGSRDEPPLLKQALYILHTYSDWPGFEPPGFGERPPHR